MEPDLEGAAIEELLRQSDSGDPEALDRLTTLLYDELRRLARRQMRDEHAGHTLQTTALVHEVYLRLAGANGGFEFEGRAQFLGLAARTMRRVLIDHARAQKRQKRGAGAIVVSLTDLDPAHDPAGAASTPADLLAIDTALLDLERFDARKAQLLELHVFGGLTYDELAAATAISRATVHRELRLGRAWLHREIFGGGHSVAPHDLSPETR